MKDYQSKIIMFLQQSIGKNYILADKKDRMVIQINNGRPNDWCSKIENIQIFYGGKKLDRLCKIRYDNSCSRFYI